MYESNASLDEDENICRVCMVKSAKRRKKNLLLSIFDPLEKKNGIQIYQALEDICHVQNLSTDSFTKKICPSCVDEVKNVYKSVNRLRDKCRESNEKFMAAFCRQKIEEVDIVIKEEEVIPDEIMSQTLETMVFDVKVEKVVSPTSTPDTKKSEPASPASDFNWHNDDDSDSDFVVPAKKKPVTVRKVSNDVQMKINLRPRYQKPLKPDGRGSYIEKRKLNYCCKCPQLFETKEELLGHFNYFHANAIGEDKPQPEGSKLSQCHLCKTWVVVLSAHIRRRHSKKKKQRRSFFRPCRYCGQKFRDLVGRDTCEEAHKSRSEKRITYDCGECEASFRTQCSLKSHLRKTHRGEPTVYECEVCGELLKTKRWLEKHLERHTLVYICNVCNNSFKRKDVLLSHLLRHFSKRDHQCDLCPKSFIVANELKRHKAIHAKHMARAAASSTTQQPQPNEFQPMANNYQILQMPQI